MNWSTIIVAIVSGISTGFLTALATPWAQWAVDVRRDRRESRRKFISNWRYFLNSSYDYDMRELPNRSDFPSLVRNIPQMARNELWQLIAEYEDKWSQFEGNELPKLRYEHSSYGGLVDGMALEERIYPVKERLSMPLRKFLFDQLAKLEEKWRLL